MQHKDILVETITYPSGGSLLIYKSGKTHYQPSQRYFDRLKELEIKKLTEEEKLKKFINYRRNKILWEKGICVVGERLLDKLLTKYTKFNFTKLKLK